MYWRIRLLEIKIIICFMLCNIQIGVIEFMKEPNLDEIVAIVNSCIKEKSISLDKYKENLVDFGMDSMAFIQIIVFLEENFECEIPDTVLLLSEMNTLEKIYNVLQKLYRVD